MMNSRNIQFTRELQENTKKSIRIINQICEEDARHKLYDTDCDQLRRIRERLIDVSEVIYRMELKGMLDEGE